MPITVPMIVVVPVVLIVPMVVGVSTGIQALTVHIARMEHNLRCSTSTTTCSGQMQGRRSRGARRRESVRTTGGHPGNRSRGPGRCTALDNKQVLTYNARMGKRIFRQDDPIHVITREGILIATGGAASLLQTAHPKVAQGVYDHSYTARDPLRRLEHTMGWVYAVACGTREEAEQVSAMVRRLHDRVTGPGYRATDPELQVWVAATLFAVSVQAYELIFRHHFTGAELEVHYQQSKIFATILGCPEEALPASYPDFREYYADMLNTLKISDASKAIADQVLYPDLPKVFGPGLMAIRLITAGLTPEPIREQYGWTWNRSRQARFRLLMSTLSLVYPRLPLPVRTLPRDVHLRRTRRMLPMTHPPRRHISPPSTPLS
jgi:uncharacterized protein (DUF2236 family)